MIQKLRGIIEEIQTTPEDEDSLDKIVVFSDYDKKMNEMLIKNEHDRMVNIHNLDAYLDLVEFNDKRFREVNNYLHNTYGHSFQKEVLKEIALSIIIKEYTLADIGELIYKHEHPPKNGGNPL